jgi:hypothetical protein
MVLEGDALTMAVAEAGKYGFAILDGGKGVRFNLPFAVSSKPINRRKRVADINRRVFRHGAEAHTHEEAAESLPFGWHP